MKTKEQLASEYVEDRIKKQENGFLNHTTLSKRLDFIAGFDAALAQAAETSDEEAAKKYVEEIDYISNENRRCAGFGFLEGAKHGRLAERARSAKLVERLARFLSLGCQSITKCTDGSELKCAPCAIKFAIQEYENGCGE